MHDIGQQKRRIAMSLRPSVFYYIGSAEGHEYPDFQVGDEVNPRTFLRSLKSIIHWLFLEPKPHVVTPTYGWNMLAQGNPKAEFQSCRPRGSEQRRIDDF